jgi:hypothetical protein
MNNLPIQNIHYVKGIDPVADAFDATQSTDIVSMRDHAFVNFVLFIGVGATGTSTITVEACDNVTPTTTSAIPFHYRQVLSGDTEGALTAATSAGFTTTAGSSKIIIVSVAAQALAASGYGFVRLKAVEVVNSPVLGGVLIEMISPRYGKEGQPTVIV